MRNERFVNVTNIENLSRSTKRQDYSAFPALKSVSDPLINSCLILACVRTFGPGQCSRFPNAMTAPVRSLYGMCLDIRRGVCIGGFSPLSFVFKTKPSPTKKAGVGWLRFRRCRLFRCAFNISTGVSLRSSFHVFGYSRA